MTKAQREKKNRRARERRAQISDIIAQRDSLLVTLKPFGWRLIGWNPGILVYDEENRSLEFDERQWRKIRPLLDELARRRVGTWP